MVSSDMPSDVHVLRLDGSADKVYVVWCEETATPFTLHIPSLQAHVSNLVGAKLTTQRGATEQSILLTAKECPVYVQIP
jgi:hypothetical protein